MNPKEQLEEAIAAVLDETSPLVVGWVTVVAYQTVDTAPSGASYALIASDGQMHHSAVGLLWQGLEMIDAAEEDQ